MHRSGSHLVAVADVPDLQTDKVAARELTVDSQVKQCKLAHPVLHLTAHQEHTEHADCTSVPKTEPPYHRA